VSQIAASTALCCTPRVLSSILLCTPCVPASPFLRFGIQASIRAVSYCKASNCSVGIVSRCIPAGILAILYLAVIHIRFHHSVFGGDFASEYVEGKHIKYYGLYIGDIVPRRDSHPFSPLGVRRRFRF